MKMYVCVCLCSPTGSGVWQELGKRVPKENRMCKGVEIKESMACLGTTLLWSVEYKKW